MVSHPNPSRQRRDGNGESVCHVILVSAGDGINAGDREYDCGWMGERTGERGLFWKFFKDDEDYRVDSVSWSGRVHDERHRVWVGLDISAIVPTDANHINSQIDSANFCRYAVRILVSLESTERLTRSAIDLSQVSSKRWQ